MAGTITPTVAQTLMVNINKAFDEGAGDAASQMSDVLDLCWEAPSDTEAGVYITGSTDFALRKRARNESSTLKEDPIALYESRLGNDSYYKIVPIDLTDWKNDKIGKYGVVFYELGMAVALGPTRLVEDTIKVMRSAQNVGPDGNGTNYDEVPLIDDAHPLKPKRSPASTTWSNELVRPAGLTFDMFAEAYQLFLESPNEDGRFQNRTPSHLVHLPADRSIAHDICFADRPMALAGAGNTWKGLVTPMQVPEMKNASNFSFALTDTKITKKRPFIFQMREALRIVPLYMNPEDPYVLKHNRLEVAVFGEYNAGFHDPHSIVAVYKA